MRRLFQLILLSIIVIGIIKLGFFLFDFFTIKVTPQDKFNTVIIIDEKRQSFGDGSDYWHFTADSNEVKTYLEDFKIEEPNSFNGQYFWPQEAPKWFHPERLGIGYRVFRRNSDNQTEFFMVNKNMTEVYYQLTVR